MLKDGQKNDLSNFEDIQSPYSEKSIDNEDDFEKDNEMLNIDNLKLNIELKNI